jgi:methionyl-tRNA formyltransferase
VTSGPDPRPRPRPVRTVFLGSGAFGILSLSLLAAATDVALVGVVTAPARPVGRRRTVTVTPIRAAAERLQVAAILTPERLRSPESVAAVSALRPELLVLADYGQIVPAALLDLPHGALNLHPSLLPRYRGASPIPAAILAGDAETGVTLMRMDEGLDTGPVVAQVHAPLEGTETSPVLEERLALMAAALLETTLGPWLRGEIGPAPQRESGATLTRPLRREDGRLDLALSAVALERQIRAYVPWPGTFVETSSLGRLIVDDATVAPSEPGDGVGHLVADGDGLALATADGRLRLGRVRVAGRKPMTAADLRRGAPGLVGSVVR